MSTIGASTNLELDEVVIANDDSDREDEGEVESIGGGMRM